MLVLTRKSEQKILIGNDVIVTILRVCGDQVSVGIEAPRSTRIFREELVRDASQEARSAHENYSEQPAPVPTVEVAVENGSWAHKGSKGRVHKQATVQEV